MSKAEVPGWRRKRFKGNKVWLEVDSHGKPVLKDSKVRIKYQLDQPHEYWVHPHHVKELGETESDAQSPPKAATKKKRSQKDSRSDAPASEAFPENAVIIYTDGASSGNPGPSGIGAVLRFGGHKREISKYIGIATNNIAELEAVRAALATLKRRDLPVRLHTDSSYVHGLLVRGWKAKKNPELVKSIRDLMAEFNDIQIIKVRGHKGVADNEAADYLATSAIRERG